MGNAEANDRFMQEFLEPHVKAIREYYNASRLVPSHDHRLAELSASAEDALRQLEALIAES